MKIAVFGAGGRIGSRIVDEAFSVPAGSLAEDPAYANALTLTHKKKS